MLKTKTNFKLYGGDPSWIIALAKTFYWEDISDLEVNLLLANHRCEEYPTIILVFSNEFPNLCELILMDVHI